MPRGRWSKQTHDRWGRCQDKESKQKKNLGKPDVVLFWCLVSSLQEIHYLISDFILSLASSTLFQSHLWFLRSHPSALPGSFLGLHPAGEHGSEIKKFALHTKLFAVLSTFKQSVWENCKTFVQELWFALLYKYLRWGTHIPGVVFRNSLVHICTVRPVDQYSRGGVTGNKNMIQIGWRKWKWLTKQNFGTTTGQQMNDSLVRWQLHCPSGFSPFHCRITFCNCQQQELYSVKNYSHSNSCRAELPYLMSTWICLRFPLLVGKNKTFKNVTLGFRKLRETFFKRLIEKISRLIDNKNDC